MALGLAVAAFGLAPDTVLETVPTQPVVRELVAEDLRAVAQHEAVYWREERVQRGDTIGSLLARAGVDDARMLAFVNADPAARALYQLRPGRPVRVATDDAGTLRNLRFPTPSGDILEIVRERSGFRASVVDARQETRLEARAGVIRSSLFGAADEAGLPDAVTLALAEAFAGELDFYHDLRRGDRFSVVYEARYLEGERVGIGRIVAAEFVNRGNTLRTFLFRDAGGSEGYYSEDGRSSRKAFLRSPMAFSRVTSGFSLARFHPILQTWRAHRGTDYAAPTGTPVRATADGVVTLAGVQGGYGNVVMVRHGGAYSTVYAHLSRFERGVRSGSRVHQGDTIGYVGATGWATGPHLHYEFRVGGEARNAQTIALPVAEPIPSSQRAAFASQVTRLSGQLAALQTVPVAALATAN